MIMLTFFLGFFSTLVTLFLIAVATLELRQRIVSPDWELQADQIEWVNRHDILKKYHK